MKPIFFLVAILASFCACAQYTRITHTSGTLFYGSRAVTVTSSGGTGTYPDACLGAPSPQYYAGASWSPGTYNYTSSAPVYALKLESHGLNAGPLGSGEYMAISINGAPYTLTPADIVSYSHCGSAGAGPCYLSGGRLYGPVGPSSLTHHNAGRILIRSCTGITSFSVMCNGIGNGVAYHISVDTTNPGDCLVASNNGPLCEGDSLKLFATGVVGTPYNWYGPAGFTSTLQNPVRPSATPAYSGVYFVVQTIGGINDTAFTTVVVNPKPAVTAIGTSPVCAGDLISFSVSPATAGATYLWTGPSGFSSTLSGPTRVATLSSAGVYTLVTSLGSCRDTDLVNIIVKPTPTVTATSSSPVCLGTTLNLYAGPFVTGEVFSWTGPGGYSSTMQNPVIAPATLAHTGTYTVVADLDGCRDTATVSVVVTATPAFTATGTSPVCAGDSIFFNVLPSAAGATYAWTGPAGFSSTLQSPRRLATLAAAGIYTVVTAIGICRDTNVVNILVQTPPAITVTGTTSVCAGESIYLYAAPFTAGVTFLWSGPGGYSSTLQNPVISSAAAGHAGIYRVIADVDGCRDTAFITIAVHAKPTITATGTASLCTGGTINLFASPFVPGLAFAWTGPGGYFSTLQNPTISPAAVSHSGTYRVIASLGSCADTAEVAVVVNPIPVLSASSNTPVCAGDSIIFTAGPAVAGQTFSWTGPAGFASGLQNPVRSPATTSHAGSYRVVTSIGVCRDTVDLNVVVAESPVISASVNSPVCRGSSIIFTASTPGAGAFYSWSGPSAFASTLQNPFITGADPAHNGLYTVIATVGSCSASTTVSVSVAVKVDVSAAGNGPVCAGKDITLSASPEVIGATYEWIGPSGFTAVGQAVARPDCIAAHEGEYRVIMSFNGCIDTAFTTVLVKPLPVFTISSDSIICEGEDIFFDITPDVPGRAYKWYGPAGFTSIFSNAIVNSATTQSAGYYYVQVTEAGCSASDSLPVKVIDLRQSLSDSAICDDQPVNVTLVANGPAEGATLWSTGSRDQSIIAKQEGLYWVKVEFAGCVGADTVRISREVCSCNAVLPTAFTPNGDNLNDGYAPLFREGCPVSDYTFMIYNRWGEQVFFSRYPSAKWDGRFKGIPAELGTYMYYLSYSAGTEKVKHTAKGDVTLVR